MASDPTSVALAPLNGTRGKQDASVVVTVSAEPDNAAPVGARHAVPLHGVTAIAAPLASPLPAKRPFESSQGKPWALPPSGLAVFYGRAETPRLFDSFLPRFLAGG